MNAKTTCTFFTLFAIVTSLAIITPQAFADHPVEIEIGAGDRGCEDTNTCFTPYEITVHPGTTVTWISNEGKHTITSGNILKDANNVGTVYPNGFGSDLFGMDENYKHTFEVVETHEYFCMLHPWTTGIVIVEAAAEEVIEETVEEVVEETAEEETVVVVEKTAEEVVEETAEEVVEETAEEVVEETAEEEEPNGCLIATATFGSELAPQVQQLRELRDNSLLQTDSGTTFMSGFNALYYSFSPTIADWERESPVFKEAVKITITPLLSSLSILNYVDIDSEAEMLGYGIGIILLNVGMYFVAPVVVILGIKRVFRN